MPSTSEIWRRSASFAERFLASGRRIDIMVNNAAVMACPETRVGRGWELQFAVNHLGHYALVNRLWPALIDGDGARVVSVASGYDPQSRIRWDDLHFERGYDKWAAYTQSKLANVLFAVELDRLGRRHGLRAFSVPPGYILTPLQRHVTTAEMVDAGWIDEHGSAAGDLFITPEQGAATQVWAATSPDLDGLGGVHCAECLVVDGPRGTDTAAAIRTQDEARRLWALSADLTGIDTPARTLPA